MSKLADLRSSLFDPNYGVVVRVVMSKDVVHRKNPDFARQALASTGFAKTIFEITRSLPLECTQQILGENVNQVDSPETFISHFLKSGCKHFVNYHDDKMCTVEFVCKFQTTVQVVCTLEEEIVEQLHLEIKTPVGEVQL